MVVHFKQADKSIAANGFTLVEVLMGFALMTLVMAGLMYGYVQANRMAEWSSMSLAAQSYASQGAEQARAANYRPRDMSTNITGLGTADELPPTNYMLCGTNYILDVPIKGNPASSDFAYFVTNYVTVSNAYIPQSNSVSLRYIRSDACWVFGPTGEAYTNTVILLRAGDQ